MSAQIKPLVLVFGSTGTTGQALVNGLLRSESFVCITPISCMRRSLTISARVAIISRSSSQPVVVQYHERGVDVRIIDVTAATPAELKEALAGVDFIVSGVASAVLEIQRPLFGAAKEAGVKRIIPSDFATTCPPGVRILHDQILAIRDYIRTLGIPYTFVEIGWWTQIVVPSPASVEFPIPLMDNRVVYGTGYRKVATTNIENAGEYVARILTDDRTINQTVFIWEHEVTTHEVWDIVQRTAEDSAAIVAKKSHVSDEDLRAKSEAAIPLAESDPSYINVATRWILEYLYSIYVRGDNTVENAKRLGALDARELYPDIKPASLEEYATTLYRSTP